MARNPGERPFVGKVEVHEGGRVAIVHSADSMVFSSQHRPPLTPLDPFASVPPRPANFIDRPEISEPLVEKLLSNAATVAITAIEGMGGVGKTIVALGLCHDERIRRAFPHGIIWLNIGKEPNVSLEKRMEYLARYLNQEFRDYSQAAYSTMLSNKAVLVVLDDVWSLDAVEPFLMPPGRSRLLYTTRDKGLAGPLGAENHEVTVLDPEQARKFLARWAGRERKPLPEPVATEILAECKGLVLGLAMIGAALSCQADSRWVFLADDLRKAKLKQVGKAVSGYHYKTLHASIEVSVNALSETQKAHYLQLAVLLEDMSASPALLQSVWGGDERYVDDLMCVLVDRSLASRDANGNIRLHDFQHAYICGEHSDSTALGLEQSALLRSLHVVRSHPKQFASQMTGRLLAHQAQPGIAVFLKDLEALAPRPGLRPLWPALQPAGGSVLRVLEGHTDWVSAVAVSDDGKRAISGSYDKSLRVWDLDGTRPPRVLEGHTDWVRSVALSGDGKRAISGSRDNTVRVWDLEVNQLPQVLEGHWDSVNAAALSGDGKRAISGSSDRTVRVWDLEGHQPPRILEGHTGSIIALALSADGNCLVSGSIDKTVRVWNLGSNQPPRVLVGHTDYVCSVVLSGNGKRAVSGSDDKTVRVWDLEGDRPPRVLVGHKKSVTAVALSDDGKRAVSGSGDKSLRVWDLEVSQPPHVLEDHAGSVTAVALSDDGKCAVSGSDDCTVRVWDLEVKRPARLQEGHTGPVTAVALSGDGKRVVSGSQDRILRVWGLEVNQPLRLLKGQMGSVWAVALSADGKRVVSGSYDRASARSVDDFHEDDFPRAQSAYALRVWDLESNQPPRLLEGHTDWVMAVALSGDGKRVVSGSQDRTLRVWDLESDLPPFLLEGHRTWVRAVALSTDGQRAVSGSDDRTLRVWDLKGKTPPRRLEGHTDWIYAVALSGDGKRAVSGSGDRTLRVWDLEGDQQSRILKGHRGSVHAVALSGDGMRALSGSEDHTLRIWDLESGNCLTVFTCDAAVLSCAWTGERIAAGDSSGQVHLLAWEE